jgi:uncharacterized protein YceK
VRQSDEFCGSQSNVYVGERHTGLGWKRTSGPLVATCDVIVALPLRLAMKSTKIGQGLIMKPLLFAICLALGGCGIVAKIDARTEYQKSVADYRACLDANPNDIHACDAKRLAMEVARRACRQQSDCWTTANINVQSR